MNQHSSNRKKYYLPLIGAALSLVSLFQLSLPVFAAGTEAGEKLLNTATGTYEDDAGYPYTIKSNTVEVTVAKVAGITNLPSGFDDLTGGGTNTTVLTGDRVSFEFTVTNVGNDKSNIFIPDLADIATKGLSRVFTGDNENQLIIQVSPALAVNGTHNFGTIPTGTGTVPDARPTNGLVQNVPINGKVRVKVTGTVSATAAGAPIEVRLGNTCSNTDINNPLPDTQNKPDVGDTCSNSDNAANADDVRTVTSTTLANAGGPTVAGDPVGGQKEASAVSQVFLGSNPLAMTRIEKTRGTIVNKNAQNQPLPLNENIIPYSLNLEVLNTTPNSLYTPGDLKGRNYTPAPAGSTTPNPNTATFNGINDITNLILISDAIPEGTNLAENLGTTTNGWTPVYTEDTSGSPDEMDWTTTAPIDQAARNLVKRVGWVYDARSPGGSGPIPAGTNITATQGGFNFRVITSGLTATGGTVANIAQVFGGTVSGADIFDESGDQDPSNFNGANPGPNETNTQSTGIADPASHGVDSGNDNNTAGGDPISPGGEDNVITIGAPGTLINGPDGQPSATGNVFGVGPDNNHDFQNLGVDNFPSTAQHNATTPTNFNPNVVVFKNTLSNPGGTNLSNVLLQPINPEFNPAFAGTGANGAKDADLPIGTTVKITLGTQNATYTYQDNTATTGSNTDRLFVLTSGTPISIPTLAAGVPLDYDVEVDLPGGTRLSTDDAINGGFAVPIVAFVNSDGNGTPDPGDNPNLTVNQVYTGFIKVTKQVRVIDGALSTPTNTVTKGGMDFDDDNTAKNPAPGDTLEYRVIYRNISEAQVGNGTNGILNGVDVFINEDGTLDIGDDSTLNRTNNNWGLDNNLDSDLDTINVQNKATDTNNGTITFYTGQSTSSTPLSGLTSAGTTDPGDTVTGYSTKIPLLAPTGAEATQALRDKYNENAGGDSAFTFQRKVDEFDGLGAENLNP